MYSAHNMHLEQLGSPICHTSSPTEPMTIGSPPRGQVSSPPGAYLPGYLLGDTSSSSPSLGRQMWPISKSPSKGRLNLSSAGPVASPNRSILSPVVVRNRNLSMNTSLSRPCPARSTADKHGGPPTQGLFDNSMNASSTSLAFGTPSAGTPATKPSTNGFLMDDQYTKPQYRQLGRLVDESFKSPVSPAQLDPFYTQGEAISPHEELDETWVTIYGFPPAAASYLLQQFSQYGNIIEHKMSSGNWMHLRYQSKLHAKKALSKNGKIFAETIMVGVSQCIDKAVMDSCKENSSNSVSSSTTPRLQRHASIRSLTQAYRIAADHDVVPNADTPQKATGLVSKSMKYLFGW